MTANHGTTRTRSHSNTKSQNKRVKDTYFTFSKDVKFFCPAGFDEGIFTAACKLLQEKVEQTKKAGADNAKSINAFEKDNFTKFFNIPDNIYDVATTQINGEAIPKILGNTSD